MTAIIAILAAMLLPALTQARERTRHLCAWIDIFSRIYVISPLISPDGGGTRLSLLGHIGPRIPEELEKPFNYPKP